MSVATEKSLLHKENKQVVYTIFALLVLFCTNAISTVCAGLILFSKDEKTKTTTTLVLFVFMLTATVCVLFVICISFHCFLARGLYGRHWRKIEEESSEESEV